MTTADLNEFERVSPWKLTGSQRRIGLRWDEALRSKSTTAAASPAGATDGKGAAASTKTNKQKLRSSASGTK
jgi:hypothetical protein